MSFGGSHAVNRTARALRENAAELRKKAEREDTPPKEQAAAVTLEAKAEKQAAELAPRDDDDDDDNGEAAPPLSLHPAGTTRRPEPRSTAGYDRRSRVARGIRVPVRGPLLS